MEQSEEYGTDWGKDRAAFLRQEGTWPIVQMRTRRLETDRTSFPHLHCQDLCGACS